MNADREMKAYFDGACFQKLFTAIHKKYRSLGRVGGTIKLYGLSLEERELLTGFLGRDCREQAKVMIRLQEVDEILQQSRFALDLPEFLSFYFGAEILSQKEVSLLESKKWEAFWARLEEQACTAATRSWMATLISGQGVGYRTVLALYRQSKPEAAELLKTCVAALDRLVQSPERRQRLPVFAAALTGDPHALDGDQPLGRLLFYGLHHIYGFSETEYGAEGRKELFSRSGLEEDDISSHVAVAGLQVQPGDPREPIFSASNTAASPLLLPLRFLEQATKWLPAELYTFENPAVFSAILDSVADGSKIPALICTSGQPSVAALKLLDQLVAAGSIIFYGGDFDPPGLEIAQRLAERYGPSFKPWFFDTTAYLQAPAGVRLTADQLKKLGNQEASWDNELVETMLKVGQAVYQEVLVGKMVEFFIHGSSS